MNILIEKRTDKLTRMKSMISWVAMVGGLWLRCWFLIIIINVVVVAVVDVFARFIVFLSVAVLFIVVRFLKIDIIWV